MGFPNSGLTAPLQLPAESGKPLTTQGGITLDNGAGLMTVPAELFAAVLSVTASAEAGEFLVTGGAHIKSGAGVPTVAGAVGDWFIRTDTPTVADQRLYVCTVAGGAGAATWVGIL